MAKNNTPADPKPAPQADPVVENTPQEPKVTCEILRDFWDGEGERKPKGTIVELGVDQALDMIEAGIAARFKE